MADLRIARSHPYSLHFFSAVVGRLTNYIFNIEEYIGSAVVGRLTNNILIL
jgi:hypothetical protein